MTYTSIGFAFFVAFVAIIYFILPIRKYRWTVLLAASWFFYLFNSYKYTLFIVLTTVTIYAAAKIMQDRSDRAKAEIAANKAVWSREERKAHKAAAEAYNKKILVAALIFNFGILFFLKYFNFAAGSLADLIGHHHDGPFLKLFLPLGISFYTFQATGYLIDVYRGTVNAEHNILKLSLFVSFFPQIVQGPISSFNQLHEQLITPHELSWRNFKLGIELIIWGLFKKLVVADRALIAIRSYMNNGGISGTEDFAGYGGTAALFVSLIYALQLYADFSGGIDISRGICRIIGIDMAVNFRQPYFSRSISEYWRRWHITLGEWMKNYVFYPIAMSGAAMKTTKAIKASRFGSTAIGKHLAKVLPAAVASFIVFLFVGIWHGANSKYIAFGIWNGVIIMLSALLAPVYSRTLTALRIKAESAWWHAFQVFRTFIIVLIGYVMDIATDFHDSLIMLHSIVFDQNMGVFLEQWQTLGMRKLEYITLLIGGLIMLYFSIRLEHTGYDSPALLLEKKRGWAEWLVVLVAIMSILIFGIYGPSFDPAEFVYMQF